MMYYDYAFFNPFHILFSLVGWILIFFLILWVVRRVSRHDRGHWIDRAKGVFRDTAMDTLRERFAKGEINNEEFEQKKKILESK